jgi:nucleoside-diphosphate-sugar epimerase
MSNANKILITGGTGTIGGALVRRLVARGHSVRVLTLPNDTLADGIKGPNVEISYGDISNPEDVNGICAGIEAVVHLAAVVISDDEHTFDRVNVTGTRYLLTDAANFNVKHFIYISSASVVYRKITPYSRSKRIAERYVRKSPVPWTIIRPTLVYGETGGMEFDMFLEYLSSYPIIPFIGSGKALKRPVYVGDLVDGIEKIALVPEGSGKTYNFSGGSTITMIDFARLCLLLLGKEDKVIVRVPVVICRLLAAFMKRMMKRPVLKWNMIAGVIQSADLDPAEAIGDLGYNPQPVEKKLGECFPRKR